jgi:hypothetical protein
VPAGVVAGVGIIIAATAVATAEAAPALPPRTAEQLITEVAQAAAKPTGPFTATVQETSDLGLPQLPSITQQAGASSPLTGGTQSVSIWYGGPQRVRLAEPVQGGETDLRLDGRTLWLWDSRSQTAIRYVLPATAGSMKIRGGNGSLRQLRPHAASGPLGQMVVATPQAAAHQILSAVGPTTLVSVQRNVYVAGRAAYQLSLVPRSGKSLVGQVLIAIDASRHIPLRVEVFPRGSSTVAYSFGYSSLTFGAPAASNFSFTPPPGATVRTQTVPANLNSGLGLGGLGLGGLGLSGLGLSALGLSDLGVTGLGLSSLGPSGSAGMGSLSARPPDVTQVQPIGTGSLKVKLLVPTASTVSKGIAFGFTGMLKPGEPLPKAAIKQITAQFERTLPKSMSPAARAKAIASFEKALESRPAIPKSAGSQLKTVGGSTAKLSLPKIKTIGTGWLAVVATAPSAQVAQAVSQALAGSATVVPSSGAYSSYVRSSPFSSVSSSELVAVGTPGPDSAVLHALLRAMRPVHGGWGSGRLLQTRLLTVLITSKGQILAGAVTPAALYADVALDAS